MESRSSRATELKGTDRGPSAPAMNCVNCHDLIFDFVYGLLDEPDANSLREHVAGCPACAIQLEKAKADQHKLGQAALAIRDVNPFAPPSERPATETIPLPASPAPSAPRRGPRAITLIAWAATLACCALVAVSLAVHHRDELSRQESRVADLIRQNDAVNAQLASLDAKFALEQQQLPELVKKDTLQLHVSGPGQMTPDLSAGLQVAIRDLNGLANPGKIDVEYVNDKNQSLAKQSVDIRTTTDLPVPAELAQNPGPVRLKIVAQAAGKTVAAIDKAIVSRPPELASHVAMNKVFYKPNDKMQVRALVVDRVTLKPAPAGVKVGVTLVAENGRATAPAVEMTTLAGMAAGEIALPANLADGVYTLEARSPDLATVRRRVEVLPASAPPVDVLATNNRYKQGEPITQHVVIYNADGSPAANVPVFGNANIAEQKADARGNNANAAQQNRGPYNFQGQTDNNGQYQIKLPGVSDAQNSRQQWQADLSYGRDKKNKATLTREIQVQPSRVVVEFYPEGGQLIAGTANRVFYRVRAPEGDAASARIAVRSSKGPIYEAPKEVGVGSFTLVPDPKESYTLSVVEPKQTDVPLALATLGLRGDGLLLRGNSVQSAGDPLKMTLENRGPERVVQVVATCRGQVVFHKRLSLPASAATAQQTPLAIDANVDGVIRVTAFEVADGQLVPLTERLFFRPSSRRLDVAVQADNAKNPVTLIVKGFGDNRQPLAFWALASVVDDRYRGDVQEPTLSDHFLLLGDAPSGVDFADLPIVGVDDVNRKADLELALGVIGWRRLGPAAPNPTRLAQDRSGKGPIAETLEAAAAKESSGTVFFYRVEPSTFDLRQKLQQVQAAELVLIDAARAKKDVLVKQRTEVADLLANARVDLDELTRRPRQIFLLGLGILALLLVVVGVLVIIYGMIRLLRRLPAAGAFGAACACLAACLVLLVVFRPQDAANVEPMAGARKNESGIMREFQPDPRLAQQMAKMKGAPQANGMVALPDRESIAEAADRNQEERQKIAAAAEPRDRPDLRRKAEGALPGERMARLEQSRQIIVRSSKEAEMNRAGSEKAANADNRAFALELQNARPDHAASSPAGLGIAPGVAGGSLAPRALPKPASEGSSKDGSPTATKTLGAAPMTTAAPPAAPGPAAVAPPAAVNAARSDDASIPALAKKLLSEKADKIEQRVNLDGLTRQFAARRAQELADPATLLWNPALSVPAAGVSIPLDLPAGPARYRVLLFGHTDDGRLGFYDGVLSSK